MKLRTCLQLSAVFPIVLAALVALLLMDHLRGDSIADQWLATALLAVVGAMALAMSAIILLYSRRLTTNVQLLSKWIDSVLRGNLDDYQDAPTGNDEIARLSKSLSNMLRELKHAYAEAHKKAESQKHLADENRRQAEASRVGMHHVSEALHRLQESKDLIVQRERQEVHEHLVRNVTHDVSEALTPLLGTLEMLRAHPEILNDPAEKTRCVDEMIESVNRATRTIKQLAGTLHKAQIVRNPVDLNELVNQTVALTKHSFEEDPARKGGSLLFKTYLTAKYPVAGEESELRNALLALFSHSAQSMPDGGVIYVSTRSDNVSVVLEVRNTGGAPDSVARQQPVNQRPCVGHFPGFGKGLAEVLEVVERHGGTLNAETGKNHDNLITVYLPQWRDESIGPRASASAEPAPHSRILVVDDDKWSRDTIDKELRALGHEVHCTSSGDGCLELLRKSSFDLVILDKAMPGMNGIELSSHIKSTWRNMPVIMLTGFGHTMIEESETPATVDLVLPKPLHLSDLEQALSRLLRTAAGQT